MKFDSKNGIKEVFSLFIDSSRQFKSFETYKETYASFMTYDLTPSFDLESYLNSYGVVYESLTSGFLK